MSNLCPPCVHLLSTLCPPYVHLVPIVCPPFAICVSIFCIPVRPPHALDCVLCIIDDFIIRDHSSIASSKRWEESEEFYELKKNLDIEDFNEKYPGSESFCRLLMYAKALKFNEKPDYEKIRDVFNGEYQNLKGKLNMP